MGVRQYQLGKKHGREGVRALAHRKGKAYDSDQAQRSYIRGYSDGWSARRKGLDYSNRLNTQLFHKETK